MLFRWWRARQSSGTGLGVTIKKAVTKRILLLVLGYVLSIILTALLGPTGAMISQFIQNQL